MGNGVIWSLWWFFIRIQWLYICVDRLHKKKLKKKTYLCLSSKTIVITSANIVVIVVSKLFSAGV